MAEPSTDQRPPPAVVEQRTLVGDSARIAVATALSRLTGLVRIAVAAAVLGPTVLGDLFIAVNVLPLILYDVLAGSAITSVLVPPLVRRTNDGDRGAAARLANNALGLIAVAMGVVAALAVLGRSWIAAALTAGVDDVLRADATATAGLLAALILPQLVAYGAIGVLVSVQHAGGRFVLPAAAPIVENLGLVATVAVVLARYGRGWEVTTAPPGLIVTLALGSGLSVLAHAVIQHVGARRASGSALRPRLGWRHPDVAALARPAADSFGWSSVIAVRQFVLVAAASYAGAGGVQAFELATLAYFVPLALIGRPIASAALPRLAAAVGSPSTGGDDAAAAVAAGYRRTLRLAAWTALPASLGLALLARPLAQLLGRGEFATPTATTLVTYGLIGLAIGAASEALFEVGRQAAMAGPSRAGLRRSTWLRALVTVVGTPAVVALVDGPSVLLGLGLVVSAGDLAALAVLHRSLPRATDRSPVDPPHWPRMLGAALGAALPVLVLDRLVEPWPATARLALVGPMLLAAFAGAAWLVTDRGRDLRSLARSLDGNGT